MTDEEYRKGLKALELVFATYRKDELELVPQIISDDKKQLFDDSLFFASVIDRSLSLSDGLRQLLESRNLISAGILLRAQIDNCMKIYVAFISKDSNEFFKDFYRGKRIDQMYDRCGKLMKDRYLKKGLSEYDKNLASVYNNASGFVHLSSTVYQQF